MVRSPNSILVLIISMSRSYKKTTTRPFARFFGFNFRYSPKRQAVASCLYGYRKQIIVDAEDYEDYLENTYKDRTRHTSLRYPHYTSSFEDRYPASLSDKWSEQVKPSYCDKKRR